MKQNRQALHYNQTSYKTTRDQSMILNAQHQPLIKLNMYNKQLEVEAKLHKKKMNILIL